MSTNTALSVILFYVFVKSQIQPTGKKKDYIYLWWSSLTKRFLKWKQSIVKNIKTGIEKIVISLRFIRNRRWRFINKWTSYKPRFLKKIIPKKYLRHKTIKPRLRKVTNKPSSEEIQDIPRTTKEISRRSFSI